MSGLRVGQGDGADDVDQGGAQAAVHRPALVHVLLLHPVGDHAAAGGGVHHVALNNSNQKKKKKGGGEREKTFIILV